MDENQTEDRNRDLHATVWVTVYGDPKEVIASFKAPLRLDDHGYLHYDGQYQFEQALKGNLVARADGIDQRRAKIEEDDRRFRASQPGERWRRQEETYGTLSADDHVDTADEAAIADAHAEVERQIEEEDEPGVRGVGAP